MLRKIVFALALLFPTVAFAQVGQGGYSPGPFTGILSAPNNGGQMTFQSTTYPALDFTLGHSNTSVTTFPVPGFVAQGANQSIALDLWPQGTGTGGQYLSWIDECASTPCGFAVRMANTGAAALFDTHDFGSGAMPMIFDTNTLEAFRIDVNQRVGIGTGSATISRALTVGITNAQLNRAITSLSLSAGTSVYNTIGRTTDEGFWGSIGVIGDGLYNSAVGDVELGTGTGRLLFGGGQGAGTSGGIQAILNPPTVVAKTDLTQLAGGSTALAFAATTGMATGQTVSGPSTPLGTTVSSIVSTAQVTFATTGSSTNGQKVVSYTGAGASEAVGQQCQDVTAGHTAYIPVGNLIASIQAGTSITLTNNIATTVPSGDSIRCDPVVTLSAATTAQVTAGGAFVFDTNHTSLSASSASVDQGDQSVYGNLIVGGLAFLPGLPSDSGQSDATVCDVTGTGKIYYGSGTGGICLTTSTRRAKTDIAPESEGLEQVMALEPVGFNYKPGHGFDPAHRYNGFIAEDMAPVLPKLVGRGADGQPNSVDMMGLVPVLVKAMQQQQREIDGLKAELRAAGARR